MILTYGHDPDANLPAPKKEDVSIVVFGDNPDKRMINSLGLKLFFGLGVAAGMIAAGKGNPRGTTR